ncbi:WD40/YVTN/BNR-like repeat-containing protein [Pseudomonas sp. nanlin1]|uniref:WD40/YVTN/BNR-like repeat-containing protein n=1 Tax=Pseudomonas sp. nanlin1 TaxID=3040605 RepID=UPI00388F4D9A
MARALIAVLGLALALVSLPNLAAPPPAHTLLLDLAVVGERLVAVGERGRILYSDDQGASWQAAQVPTRQMLTAVYFVDGQHGWAVGHDAQILYSADAGATWARQYEDRQREAPLLDVWFQDAHHGLAVGAYGALLETHDGGAHWQDVSERLDNPEQLHLNGLAEVKDAGLVLVGEQGSLFRSRDAGRSWVAVASPYAGSLFGVIATGRPRTLLVYGLQGNLWRSDDFGDRWQPVRVEGSATASLAGATRLAAGSLVVVGNAGTLLRSDDDGVHFTAVQRSDRRALAAVVGLPAGGLALAGEGGVQVTAGQASPP